MQACTLKSVGDSLDQQTDVAQAVGAVPSSNETIYDVGARGLNFGDKFQGDSRKLLLF